MGFLEVLIKMIELFAIIIIGYIAAKCNVLNKEAKQYLSKIVLNISMPCTILSAVMNSESMPGTSELILLLAVSFSSYAILFALAKLTPFLLKSKGKEKGAVEFGIMFANVGFIGFPVTEAVFGSGSMLYTTVFNIPFNLLCYSLGVRMIMAEDASDNNRGRMSKDELFKLLFTPAMISSVIAILMAFTGWQGPDIIGDTCEIVGGITTPAALLIIGSALSEMSVKEMFSNARAYIFTLISVIVTPLIMYVIYRPIAAFNPLLFGETVVISAMPVATAGTMLCVENGGDEKFMAQITFLTTFATVVTIPLISIFL